MTEEIERKKKLPKWVLVIGAALIIVAIAVIALLISGGTPAKRVAKKLELADRYMTELKYDEAIALYNEVLEIESKNVKAYAGLFDAYIKSGNEEKAQEVLDTLISLSADESSSDFSSEIERMKSRIKESKEASSVVSNEIVREEAFDDFNGDHIVDSYTADGRIVKTTWYSDGELVEWADYEYSDTGIRLKAHYYYEEGTEYSYGEYVCDANGKLLTEKVYTEDGSLYEEREYGNNGKIAKVNMHYTFGAYKWYTFEYDEEGHTIKNLWYFEDGSLGQSYEYDSYRNYRLTWRGYSDGSQIVYIMQDGIQVRSNQVDSSGNIIYWNWYEYDANGKLIKITHHDSNDSILDWTIYEYYDNGREYKHTTYDVSGEITGWCIFEDYYDDYSWKRTTYYDRDGNIREWQVREYDENGNQGTVTAYGPDGEVLYTY